MILSPYDTTYGKMLNNTKLESVLLKYVTANLHSNLNYEYKNNKNKLVIITGYCEEERQLPVFEHPIVLNGIKDSIVCVDIRKYVRQHNEQTLNIKNIIKDTSTLNFIMLRTLLTLDFVDGNFHTISIIDKNIAIAYSMILSNIFTHIANLNSVEKINIEIVLCYFIYSSFIEEKNIDEMYDAIIAKISNTKLSIPINIKIVSNALDNKPKYYKNFVELIETLKMLVTDDKKDLLNLTVLNNNLSTMWYGPGGAEAMIMSTEHIPTLTSLIYSGSTDATYKRSRLSNVLDKLSNKIKPAEIERAVATYILDYTL